MASDFPLSAADMAARQLDGPPAPGFDCGRAEQTAFLYERAWPDQLAGISATYCYYVRGIFAGYATVCMDGLRLGRRERDETVPPRVGALKLAQLGVALPFQGLGIGRLIVGDIIGRAREEKERVGCRFVTVDALPDVVDWYAKQFFVRNRRQQEERIQEAVAHGRDPSLIAVSMRYDLFPGSPYSGNPASARTSGT